MNPVSDHLRLGIFNRRLAPHHAQEEPVEDPVRLVRLVQGVERVPSRVERIDDLRGVLPHPGERIAARRLEAPARHADADVPGALHELAAERALALVADEDDIGSRAPQVVLEVVEE